MKNIEIKFFCGNDCMIVEAEEGVETDAVSIIKGRLTKARAIVKDHNRGMGNFKMLKRQLAKVIDFSKAEYIASLAFGQE